MCPSVDTHTPIQLSTPLAYLGKIPFPTNGGMRPLPLGFTPGPSDVICSRGGAVKKHPGNIKFLQVVNSHLQKYSTAGSKLEKSLIVTAIIDTIRESSPHGGGFVKQLDGHWFEAGDNLAREKVGQRLRDLLHSKYSSSSRAKKRRRRNDEADLASRVDDIVSKTNGTDLTVRVKELTAEIKNPFKTDMDFQRIFNQANCELLARIKAEESSRSSQKRKLDDDNDSSF